MAKNDATEIRDPEPIAASPVLVEGIMSRPEIPKRVMMTREEVVSECLCRMAIARYERNASTMGVTKMRSLIL